MGNDSGIYHLYNYSNNPKIKKKCKTRLPTSPE